MDEEKINRLIDAILVMQEQEDTTTPALRSQLAETESAIGNILKAIEQGIFTPSTKQRLDELKTPPCPTPRSWTQWCFSYFPCIFNAFTPCLAQSILDVKMETA